MRAVAIRACFFFRRRPASDLLRRLVASGMCIRARLVRARRVRAPATDELQWATGMDTSSPALRPGPGSYTHLTLADDFRGACSAFGGCSETQSRHSLDTRARATRLFYHSE